MPTGWSILTERLTYDQSRFHVKMKGLPVHIVSSRSSIRWLRPTIIIIIIIIIIVNIPHQVGIV